MKKIAREQYETPIVEIIEVQVEKGFANTNVENPEPGQEEKW